MVSQSAYRKYLTEKGVMTTRSSKGLTPVQAPPNQVEAFNQDGSSLPTIESVTIDWTTSLKSFPWNQETVRLLAVDFHVKLKIHRNISNHCLRCQLHECRRPWPSLHAKVISDPQCMPTTSGSRLSAYRTMTRSHFEAKCHPNHPTKGWQIHGSEIGRTWSVMYVCPLTHSPLDIHETPKDRPGESLPRFSEVGRNL